MVVAHKSSTEEIGILRKLFQKYDSRHDGSIWFEEFCQAMQGSGQSQEELRAIFDAMVRFCKCIVVGVLVLVARTVALSLYYLD